MRPYFVAGNWKMHGTLEESVARARALVESIRPSAGLIVAVCPPFPYLQAVGQVLAGSPIALGAQNAYCERQGAYTGEVSPAMLRDVGCEYVILGHSERRHILGESDELIRRKVEAAVAEGLRVILCVGETLQEREAGRTLSVIERQVRTGLEGFSRSVLQQLVLAYEPVWAIGTGHTATPEQAQEVHEAVRRLVAELFDRDLAEQLIIQYGGSVKPENAAALLAQPDVDGALVGGASLKADQFARIVATAAELAAKR